MVEPGRQRRRRVRGARADSQAVQRVDHEVALAHRVQLTRVARPGLGLTIRSLAAAYASRSVGVRTERVPEPHLLAQLPAGRRHHVAVDTERRAVVDDEAR